MKSIIIRKDVRSNNKIWSISVAVPNFTKHTENDENDTRYIINKKWRLIKLHVLSRTRDTHNTQYLFDWLGIFFSFCNLSALVGFGTNRINAWDISWSSDMSLRDGAYQIRTAIQWMSNTFSWTMNSSHFRLSFTAKCSRLKFWLRLKIESLFDRWCFFWPVMGPKVHNRSIMGCVCLSVERNSLN